MTTSTSTSTSTTHQLSVAGTGPVTVTVARQGEGTPVLVLHGGAGPQSVAAFADLLAETKSPETQPTCVLTPTHPGFGGTPRPDALTTVRGLARLYVALLEECGLTDVTVVGSSVGGWVAAEMALLGSARVCRLVLVDATGIEVPGHPVADVASLPLDEVFRLAYHDPAPFRIDVAALPPGARAVAAGNAAALAVYGGTSGGDPDLLARLQGVDLPTLVLWGESDRIVDAGYGRAYAAAIPGATFQLLPGAGHVPQLETPAAVVTAVRELVASHPGWSHDYTVDTGVAPEHVWAALRALYTGTRLSERGDTIEIHGPFSVGTELSVTPLGADAAIVCRIVELIDGEVYAYRTELDGLMITSRHALTRLAGGGTRVAQHSEITGPRAGALGPQIGPRITEDHPDAMADLLAAAQARAASPVG